MDRRNFIRASGVALTVAVAGCGSSDAETPTDTVTETKTSTPTDTETPTESPKREAIDLIEQSLRTNGPNYHITDKNVGELGPDILIEITTTAQTDSQIADAIGASVGAYIGAVEATGVTADAAGSVWSTSDRLVGDWSCRNEWAESYNNDEISSTELSRRVIETFE